MKNIIIKMLVLTFGVMLYRYNGFAQSPKCGTIFSEEDKKEILKKRAEGANILENQKANKTSGQLEFKIKPFLIAGFNYFDKLDELESKLNKIFNEDNAVNISFKFCEEQIINCSRLGILHKSDYYKLRALADNSNAINVFFGFDSEEKFEGIYLGKGTGKEHLSPIYISTGIYRNDVDITAKILAHEIGHYFGLGHTFSDTGSKIPVLDGTFQITYYPNDVEGINGENCKRAADGICDTPADYKYQILIPNDIDKKSCNDAEDYVDLLRKRDTWEDYDPQIDNYMSYYPFDCKNKFTTDQIAAMQRFAAGLKNVGSNCPNDIEDCTVVLNPELNFACSNSPSCKAITTGDGLSLNCGEVSAEKKYNTIVISNAEITNNGSSISDKVKIEYALVGSGGEIPLIPTLEFTTIIELAPGETISLGTILEIPKDLNDSYYIKAILNGADDSCISTETIDIGIEETTPPVTSGDIDLALISCGSIKDYDNGKYIENKIQNIGSETTPATKLGVYLSSDEFFDQTDSLLKESDIPSLVSYETLPGQTTFSLDNVSLPPGNAYIILKADKDDIASETNEDNNICVNKLKGETCDYTIINNTDCEIVVYWSNFNAQTIQNPLATIPPFGSSIRTIEDGFRWSSASTSPRIFYKTAYCASPTYTINASACTTVECNKLDGYITGDLDENYHAENHILSPHKHYTSVVEPNTNATFKAGEYIRLLPGFTAKYGSDFSASIAACNNESAPKISSPNAVLTLRNYPNPFTRETSIEFELRNEKPVTLFVTDMMGKKVVMLLNNEAQLKGYNKVTFNGSNYPPGMYYYTLQFGDEVQTQKMILME